MKDDDTIFVVRDGPDVPDNPAEPIPWWAHNQALLDTIATFPAEFGLRAFPGKRFCISATASFVSEGVMYLYTFIKEEGDHWAAFAKGTPAELRKELVP